MHLLRRRVDIPDRMLGVDMITGLHSHHHHASATSASHPRVSLEGGRTKRRPCAIWTRPPARCHWRHSRGARAPSTALDHPAKVRKRQVDSGHGAGQRARRCAALQQCSNMRAAPRVSQRRTGQLTYYLSTETVQCIYHCALNIKIIQPRFFYERDAVSHASDWSVAHHIAAFTLRYVTLRYVTAVRYVIPMSMRP